MSHTGPIRIKDRHWLIDQLCSDHWLRTEGKIVWDKVRRSFHLVVVIKRPKPKDTNPEGTGKTVVSLDPGCRRFQEFYSPDGTHGELLARYMPNNGTMLDELERRCHKIDAYQQRSSVVTTHHREYRALDQAEKLKWKPIKHLLRREQHPTETEQIEARLKRYRNQRRNCQRRKRLEYRKLVDFRHQAHYSAVNQLLTNWDVVVYSNASFKNMCSSPNRPFGKKTARQAYNWCHYQFNQRLISKAESMPGKHAIAVEEDGTTMTCGLCGTVNKGVGGSKWFHCISPDCHVKIDRDVNGARNNLLCALTRTLGYPRG